MCKSNRLRLGGWYGYVICPKRQEWEDHLNKAKELGINPLGYICSWGMMEPKEGKIDFDESDAFLELAEKKGVKVVLYLQYEGEPRAIPFWLPEKYPDSYVEMANGQKVYVTRHSLPTICFDDDRVAADAYRFGRTVVSRYEDHPAVFGWDVWNETWLWKGIVETDVERQICFCPHTLRHFQKWLQEKYGDISTLNQVWAVKFEDFGEVQFLRYHWDYPAWVDHRLFMPDNLGRQLEERIQVVKGLDQLHPVMCHGGTVSCSGAYGIVSGGNDWLDAKRVDIYGVSLYPKALEYFAGRPGSEPCLARAPLLLDQLRSACPDFWVSEFSPGNEFGLSAMLPEMSPEELCLWYATTIAHGAKSVLLCGFIEFGYGEFGGMLGLVKLNGEITDRGRAIAKLFTDLKRYEDKLVKARPPHADVAIWFDPKSHLLSYAINNDVEIYSENLLGYYASLWEENFAVDIISPYSEKRNYRCVIFPNLRAVDDEVVGYVKQLLDNGATVIFDAMTGSHTKDLWPSKELPGGGLDRLLGVREKSSYCTTISYERGREVTDEITIVAGDHRFKGSTYVQQLEAVESIPVAFYQKDNHIAGTMRQISRGKGYFFGTLLGKSYVEHQDEGLRELLAQIVSDSGVRRVASNPAGQHRLLITRTLEGNGYRFVFALNYSKEEQSWDFPFDDVKIVDVRTHREIDPKEKIRIAPRSARIFVSQGG